MFTACLQQALKPTLSQHVGAPVASMQWQVVGGGSINHAYKITVNNQIRFFIKVNDAAQFPQLFEKEKNGLTLINQQQIIKTPQIIDCSAADDMQILVLEWIDEGKRTKNFWNRFGAQLAALHHVSHSNFGLTEDNYMGSISQINTLNSEWNNFFITNRLQPLVKQCFDKHLLQPGHLWQFEQLYPHLSDVFNIEPPALVHGDLWSGNFMCNQSNEPVLIDPAIYFGHRSVDLAMTTLFGGFDDAFYDAYHYYYPLPSNYDEQWKVCNLYPLLIHLLLFGKSYLPQIEATLNAFA